MAKKQCSKLHMLCNYKPTALQKWGTLSMPSSFYITMTFSASVSSAVHCGGNHLQNLITTLQSPEELTFSFGNHSKTTLLLDHHHGSMEFSKSQVLIE